MHIQYLLQQAQEALQEKDYHLANSRVERAIRLEHANPWLWYNLAVIRVRQKEYRHAIQIALRSNDLSVKYANKKRVELQLNNWKLIHYCHLQLNEPKKAKKALKFVEKLSF